MTPRLSLTVIDYLNMAPDFRSEQANQYPLCAILAQACAAVLCG
jgi:hypothetical protein